MTLPETEKDIRKLDAELSELRRKLSFIYERMLAMDEGARGKTDGHHYRFELRGLEQAMNGLGGERLKLAAKLGQLLLGIEVL